MKERRFELLLAMMRLLRHDDQSGLSLEASIMSIMDSFGKHFDDEQRQIMARVFLRYTEKLQKIKQEDSAIKAMESEAYKRTVGEFFIEESW
jgi:hypothetical protein